ncbi:MAG: serine/threonine protein kinase [Verrucomicrobia bacterium]|nr:serine/threonine protein kinase [Verrucomicrobiota bacterium]
MPETSRCPVCGTPLPSDAPEGLCPRCSFGGALEVESEGREQRSEVSDQETTDASPLPRRFGDYELLEEIAHGGMGVVYKARQGSLNRTVAVKLIRAGPYASKEYVHRFRVEASAAAVLQHPHIVAVHEVGVHQGQHYFSMDYVAGRSLAQIVREGPLAPNRAARYVQQIAEAIEYAHAAGILHRDLKPSNVLIDAQDQPRITDFGLAKQLHSDSAVTLTGEVIGTPGYMPPEQASGRRGAVQAWSDVYSLGAILYHLLTGRAPFAGLSIEATIDAMLHQDPVSVRLLNPAVPRDLDTICLKCLEKEPAKRYVSAQLLAEELGRFLNQKPILARPLHTAGRTWRWCRRNPRLASAVGLAVLSLLIGLAGVSWQWRRAESQRQRAEAGELLARQQGYVWDMNLAQQAITAKNRGRALELLNRHRPADKSEIRNPKSESSSGVTFGNTAKAKPKRSWAGFPVAFVRWRCRLMGAGS